uniref:BEN domain-containing protein n=1 Tax=Eptatretus burgeri TaxID=7764 RepID=A0A8C4NCI3_EPTBU
MKKQIWKKIRMRNIERIRKRRPANTNNHLIQKMDGLEKKIEMLTSEIQALRKEFSHFGNNITSVESDPSLPSTAQALTFAGHEQNFSSAELAPGVIIGVAELRNCRRSNYQRFTRDLMSVIFTEEDMAKCSVLGKRGVAGRGAAQRPPLPYDKVQAIIYHVQEQFFINPSLIRQAMASKLSDVRKSLQKRHSVT